jgi:hypothetical protein
MDRGSSEKEGLVSNIENVLPLARSHGAPEMTGTPELAGQGILAMLRQAAEAAQRNEDRAKAEARYWHQQCTKLDDRVQALQAELMAMEARALEAEKWIERIFHSVKDALLDPLLARTAERRSKA